jgi:hypothetical protein
MREIIIPFTPTVSSKDGATWRVNVIGHERADGIWEGTIEFQSDKARLVTRMETTQRNSNDITSWATALKPIYFERALDRARPR